MITFYRLIIFSLIITVAQNSWASEPPLSPMFAQPNDDSKPILIDNHLSDPMQNLITSLIDDDPYTINTIKVDVTSASASDARNKAISEAQRQGFIQLINVIIPDQVVDSKTITDADLDFMVQDFEILHEKITTIRYVGDFKIKFNKVAVEKILARYNIVVVARVQELQDLVIIPLFNENNLYKLWDESNPWFEAWSQGSKEITTNNITVPVGDLDDIKQLSSTDINDGNHKKIAEFIKRYGVHHGLVALLKTNNAHDQLHHYTLELLLYSQNDLVASLESTIQPTATDQRIFFKHLVQKTCELLPQLQAEMNTTQLNQKINFTINFTSLEQWVKMRNLFNYKPLFKNLHVHNVSRHQAKISVVCVNSINRMTNHLKTHGYEIQQQSAHDYLLVPSISLTQGHNNTVFNSSSSHVDQHIIEQQHPNNTNVGQSFDSTSINGALPNHTTERASPYYMPSEIENSLSAP